MEKIIVKVQSVVKHQKPAQVNKTFKEMRKALKCSIFRLHFPKRIPEDHPLIKNCRESTVQHHGLGIARFLKLKKYYCYKCQAIYYKEDK